MISADFFNKTFDVLIGCLELVIHRYSQKIYLYICICNHMRPSTIKD